MARRKEPSPTRRRQEMTTCEPLICSSRQLGPQRCGPLSFRPVICLASELEPAPELELELGVDEWLVEPLSQPLVITAHKPRIQMVNNNFFIAVSNYLGILKVWVEGTPKAFLAVTFKCTWVDVTRV